MGTQTAIHLEDFLPATFTAPELTDEQFLAVCELFPEATLEYTEEGEIVVMPPADPLNGARGALVVHRLVSWAEKTGREERSAGRTQDTSFRHGPAVRRMRPGLKATQRPVLPSPFLPLNS